MLQIDRIGQFAFLNVNGCTPPPDSLENDLIRPYISFLNEINSQCYMLINLSGFCYKKNLLWIYIF